MICTACHTEVKSSDAHIRSSLFVQVAWCGPCWQTRPEVFIPQQRAAMSEKVDHGRVQG